MRLLLLWSIFLAVAGICIMLFGIGMLTIDPSASLPSWVKVMLVILAGLFIVIYGILFCKLIFVLTQANNGIMVQEGGIWL